MKFKDVEYTTTDRGTLGAVKFERQYGIAYSEAFAEGGTPRMEWMAFLAYSELQADKVDVGPFDDEFLIHLDFLPPTPEEIAKAVGAEVEGQLPLVPEVQPT